jgi:hypothetical protein
VLIEGVGDAADGAEMNMTPTPTLNPHPHPRTPTIAVDHIKDVFCSILAHESQ